MSFPSLSADRIAELIVAAGFPAVVWQSGGGTATIAAGGEILDQDGVSRSQLLIGPGTYGWGERPSVFDQGELYAGPDDDGDDPDAHVDVFEAGHLTEQAVADLAVSMLRAGA